MVEVKPDERGKCRSCGADVLLAVKIIGPDRIPVDPAESPDGAVFLTRTERGLTAVVPSTPGVVIKDATRHAAHRSTCPNADVYCQ